MYSNIYCAPSVLPKYLTPPVSSHLSYRSRLVRFVVFSQSVCNYRWRSYPSLALLKLIHFLIKERASLCMRTDFAACSSASKPRGVPSSTVSRGDQQSTTVTSRVTFVYADGLTGCCRAQQRPARPPVRSNASEGFMLDYYGLLRVDV